MTGIVNLSPVRESDPAERQRFAACLINRMEYGPMADPEREADIAVDPDMDPLHITITNPDLDDLERARAVVAEQADACNPAWRTLYEFSA